MRAPVRRFVGALLMLAVALSLAEPLLADTCDGDGEALQVMSASPVGSPSAPDSGSPGAPVHGAHLCHCTHVHGGLPGIAFATPDADSVFQRPPRMKTSAPLAPAVEPRLRPPLTA